MFIYFDVDLWFFFLHLILFLLLESITEWVQPQAFVVLFFISEPLEYFTKVFCFKGIDNF